MTVLIIKLRHEPCNPRVLFGAITGREGYMRDGRVFDGRMCRPPVCSSNQPVPLILKRKAASICLAPLGQQVLEQLDAGGLKLAGLQTHRVLRPARVHLGVILVPSCCLIIRGLLLAAH